MTLILCAANDDQLILVSDRRLTWNGQTKEEEWNKASSLLLRDARLAVAFTGIASAGNFNTRRWLETAIMKSAAPDYTMEQTLLRLCERATADFRSLRVLAPKIKRLSIIVAGYSYAESRPRFYCSLISNFQVFKGFRVRDAGDSEGFNLSWIREESPSTQPKALIAFAGFDAGVSEAENS